MDFSAIAKRCYDPEEMAALYLSSVFGDKALSFPINPFALLKEEGILFTLSSFSKLEGVYIPAETEDDFPVVAINSNRPITRQRFTAAHELCHHFRDAGKQICSSKNLHSTGIEKYAEGFAAAVLMPIQYLRIEVNKRRNADRIVSFDDVLEIADYFGVSFESCVFRIAYRLQAIDGDIAPESLKKRIREYKPDKVRKEQHKTCANLYADLIDCYSEQLAFIPSDYAKNRFQNEYIYNDSRMEGLDITIEAASEIVTDLRLNSQSSQYCVAENEPFMSIAGHYAMYQEIFAFPIKETLSVFDAIPLHRKLFSCYPSPEFGGRLRQTNTLVLGAKFETADYHDIPNRLVALDKTVKDWFSRKEAMKLSEYIQHVVRVHHQLTIIHPFPEGNGRTSRAFMNMQFVRSGLPPIYITVRDKRQYLNALSYADKTGSFDELNEVVFKALLSAHVELKEFGI